MPRLLQDLMTQNSRIRQLLNRISGTVRDYDDTQIRLLKDFPKGSIKYRSLPPDLLETFSHDPAAVTGSTRRYKGFRAVDDIHNRLVRQREVFQLFIANEARYGVTMAPKGVLTEPITQALASLEKLEKLKEEVKAQVTQVSSILKDAQKQHAVVKSDYNETLSHVSVVYPEVSNQPLWSVV
jgi:hypothetical protein